MGIRQSWGKHFTSGSSELYIYRHIQTHASHTGILTALKAKYQHLSWELIRWDHLHCTAGNSFPRSLNSGSTITATHVNSGWPAHSPGCPSHTAAGKRTPRTFLANPFGLAAKLAMLSTLRMWLHGRQAGSTSLCLFFRIHSSEHNDCPGTVWSSQYSKWLKWYFSFPIGKKYA